MRSRAIQLILFLLVPLSIGFGEAGDRLLLIRRGDAPGMSGLVHEEIIPHFKGEGWIVASGPLQAVDGIRRRGFEVEVIGNYPWSEPCYFVGTRRGGPPLRLQESLEEIARVPGGVIVKGAEKAIGRLTRLGLSVAMIRDISIPVIERQKVRFRNFTRNFERPLDSIAEEVSDSTLMEYVRRLADFRTRYSCTDSNWAAGQWIYDKFLEFGYTDVSFDSFPYNPPGYPCNVQRNVVAVKEGTLAPDRVIVIGGHYDSFTYINEEEGCNPDTLAPGADDNASGTAVVLETARLLVDEESDATLIFVAFGGEEEHMWGSYHFAEDAYNKGMDIAVMLNMDMVAFDFFISMHVSLMVDSSSVPFAEAEAEIAENYTDLIPEIHVEQLTSDALPFYEYGYNTVWTFEGWRNLNFNLHTCADTVGNLDIPYFTNVAEMIALSTFYFSNVPATPSGFNVVNVGDGNTLYLSWEPNMELDLAGYNIYYGTQPGIYDSVKTVTTPNDTLRNLNEGTVFYLALSAFDIDGHESFLTDDREILVSSRPFAPVGITSFSLDSLIIIGWQRNQSELDLAGYNIYRRTVSSPPDTMWLGFVEDPITSFHDTTAEVHLLYGYHVTAVDTQVPPAESDPSEEVYGRLATHDQGILIVDNTLDGTGGLFSPTDEEVDAFYSDSLLGNYNVQAFWDLGDSVFAGRFIMDYDMGIYSTVLWHSDTRFDTTVASDTTAMRKYLESGGNLWLSGWKVISALMGNSDQTYYVFEGDGFIPQYMGIDSATTTSSSDVDFIGARSLLEGFPSVQVDSEKVSPLGALFNTEILLPPFDGAYPLYAYVSSDSSNSMYHGLPVAVSSSAIDYGLIVTDLPLFFMEMGSARTLAEAVMDLFGEPVSVAGDYKAPPGLPGAFAMSQNFPNPFNPSTEIGYAVPFGYEEGVRVKLEVFTIRGKRVATLVDGIRKPGFYRVHWDSRDEGGRRVGSGIYLYRIKAGPFSSVRKMVIVK